MSGEVKFDQATKGVRWMPWHREAMKDVATCDKPRVAGSKLIRGSPNGETRPGKPRSSPAEFIGRWKPTQGSETSQYLEEKKANRDSVSSGERTRNSPNRRHAMAISLVSAG
jgi:hypothetical protein